MVGVILRRTVAGMGLVWGLWAAPAWAAERILIRFGPLTTPVEVKELQALAATGQASERLATLLGLMGLKASDAQRFLSQAVPITRANLDRMLNSFVGNVILSQMATFVQPANGGDGVAALKTGLTQAVQNNSLTLLNLIQSYPGDITLDAQRGMTIYRQIQADAQNLPQVLAALDEVLPLFVPGFRFSAGCPPR